ncbi:Lipoprotein releasing system transmembrane protein LolC [Desulfurella amilsii]|uniref:Lipoprotein releasing system transmembrane protein LolC n=1 Tax=Desulfurella amilsii TaxID=1562698 RepID=A0A1X4XVP2_9BACT|nr:ABC transporter permease [Desulfurella amilsii]OSS41600.1 Lipoprotein releasing system transmembrane protein LolC [Desulfurella amilsii]
MKKFNFENFLAIKYISSKKEEKLISLSSLLSIISIAIGVGALILVLGIMNGFDKMLESKIIGANPHIIIKNFDGTFNLDRKLLGKIKSDKMVANVYPSLVEQCIVSANGQSSGSILNGVDFSDKPYVEKYIKGRTNGIVLGKELMKAIGVSAGQNVRVTLAYSNPTAMGFSPVSFEVPVTGVFDSGMYEYDLAFSYIPLDVLWKNMQTYDQINTIAVNLYNPYNINKVGSFLGKILPSQYYFVTWAQMNKNFFTALKLEKIAMGIILLLIIIVAAFDIMNSLTMLVMEKVKDIAILVSLGATSKNIKSIFIKQGLILGFIGTIIGDFLGLSLGYILKHYDIVSLPKQVYYITKIPVDITLTYVVGISIVSVGLCVLASLYPASKASRMNIIEVLRQ